MNIGIVINTDHNCIIQMILEKKKSILFIKNVLIKHGLCISSYIIKDCVMKSLKKLIYIFKKSPEILCSGKTFTHFIIIINNNSTRQITAK